MTKIALGLMSGTSADGLTVCAVRPAPFKILHFKNYPYPPALQQRLLNALHLTAPELSRLHFELGALYAKIVRKFLKDFFNKNISQYNLVLMKLSDSHILHVTEYAFQYPLVFKGNINYY